MYTYIHVHVYIYMCMCLCVYIYMYMYILHCILICLSKPFQTIQTSAHIANLDSSKHSLFGLTGRISYNTKSILKHLYL